VKSWQALVSLLCLGLTTYFVYHTIHGRHGFEARKITFAAVIRTRNNRALLGQHFGQHLVPFTPRGAAQGQRHRTQRFAV
jgi:hypothetical protein